MASREKKLLDIAVEALERVGASYPRITEEYRMKIANMALIKIKGGKK